MKEQQKTVRGKPTQESVECISHIQYLNKNHSKALFDTQRMNGLMDLLRDTTTQLGERLLFEVRKGNPIVYFSGGKIIDISSDGAGNIRFKIDEKYAIDDDDTMAVEEFNKRAGDIDFWISGIDKLKSIMRKWWNATGKKDNSERKKQQLFALDNDDFNNSMVVLDTEYGATTWSHLNGTHKISKVDMVAVVKNKDGEYDIVLIEFKDKDTTVGHKCGVADHVRDFSVLIEKKAKDIKESIKNIFDIKSQLGLFKNVPENFQLSGNIDCMILLMDVEECVFSNEITKVKMENIIDGRYKLYSYMLKDSGDYKLDFSKAIFRV